MSRSWILDSSRDEKDIAVKKILPKTHPESELYLIHTAD